MLTFIQSEFGRINNPRGMGGMLGKVTKGSCGPTALENGDSYCHLFETYTVY